MTLNSHTVGKYAAPLAPAIFYGWAIYEASLAAGILQPLAIIGALAAVVALEAVGMGAGDNAMRFTVMGHWLAIPSWVALTAYTGVGMYELWGTSFQFIFMFAFLAYVGAGINAVDQRNTAAKMTGHEERKAAQLAALQAEERAKSQEAERAQQLKLAQLAAQKEVQLAKVTAATSRQDSGNLPHEKRQETSGKASWRTMSPEERLTIARATPAQLAEKYPHVAERTIRKWRQDSAQLAATVPPNSPYVAEQGASGD